MNKLSAHTEVFSLRMLVSNADSVLRGLTERLRVAELELTKAELRAEQERYVADAMSLAVRKAKRRA